MTANDIPARAIDLGIERLLLVATGSVAAGDLPFWATWLRTYQSDLAVDIVLTRGAHRFVRPAALHGRVTGRVLDDTWPEDETSARHVDFLEWAQAILVFPATFHYTARLALGLADSPSLLAAQCASVPVVLAPALPPGGTDSEAYRSHVRTLSGRRTTRVVPPRPGVSTTTGRADSWAPALVPDCLVEIARLRAELATVAGDVTRYPRSA